MCDCQCQYPEKLKGNPGNARPSRSRSATGTRRASLREGRRVDVEVLFEVGAACRAAPNGKLLLRESETMETPAERQEAAPSPPTLADLFLLFLRLGATAFGGPAMVPYVGEFVVKRRKWMDPQTFKGGVVLAQSIPGATLMQTVAYVGLQMRGLPGALVSYIAFGLPAFLLMLAFSAVYAAYGSLPRVTSVFSGLQVIVIAIIANATYTFGRSSIKHYMHVLLAAASAVAFWLGVSPFYVILGAALAGICFLRGDTGDTAGKDTEETHFSRPCCQSSFNSGARTFISLPRPSRPSQTGPSHDEGRPFCLRRGLCFPAAHAPGGRSREGLDGREDIHGRHSPGPGNARSYRHHRRVRGIPDASRPGCHRCDRCNFRPIFHTDGPDRSLLQPVEGFSRLYECTHGVLASFVGLLLFVVIRFSFAVPWDFFRVSSS